MDSGRVFYTIEFIEMFLNVFVILPGINLQNHCVVAWFSLDD